MWASNFIEEAFTLLFGFCPEHPFKLGTLELK